MFVRGSNFLGVGFLVPVVLPFSRFRDNLKRLVQGTDNHSDGACVFRSFVECYNKSSEIENYKVSWLRSNPAILNTSVEVVPALHSPPLPGRSRCGLLSGMISTKKPYRVEPQSFALFSQRLTPNAGHGLGAGRLKQTRYNR